MKPVKGNSFNEKLCPKVSIKEHNKYFLNTETVSLLPFASISSWFSGKKLNFKWVETIIRIDI